MRNLPEKLTITLTMDLKKATNAEEMQSIINIYLHDNRTGLPRGMQGPMVCLTNQDVTSKTKEDIEESVQSNGSNETKPATESSINAATKGKQKADGTKGKGYGQCWECGEWGHPRRECEVYLKRMGKGNKVDESIAAIKGYGKFNKGGKGWKGKGKNGNGKRI